VDVHPAAAVFPMLDEEELTELAIDINANGLQQPIVLDADGQLIDGRNRLRACAMAGVEPRFTTLDGQDPVAYILSANIARRHLTTGQRAMAAAQVERFATNQSVRTVAHASGVAHSRIVKAHVVMEYAPDLVAGVLRGELSLDAAYEEARRRKSQADSTEVQMERLRHDAPDLADLVVEERMTLREAQAALDERRKRRAEDITIISDRLSKAVKTILDLLPTPEHRARVMDLFADSKSYLDEPLTCDLLDRAVQYLAQLAQEWPR
jgi:hypothetical protein